MTREEAHKAKEALEFLEYIEQDIEHARSAWIYVGPPTLQIPSDLISKAISAANAVIDQYLKDKNEQAKSTLASL